MATDPRHHLPPTDADDGAPRHLTRQEFARRLAKTILDRGWSQSDLARASGLGRDAISTYIRGRSLPGPTNLSKIANALSVGTDELLPNTTENAVDNDQMGFEMRAAAGHPDKVWVRLNRMLTLRQALAVAHILDMVPSKQGEALARRSWAEVGETAERISMTRVTDPSTEG